MPEQAVVYVGLGSNLDGPEQQLLRAFDELDRLEQTRLQARSSLYGSPPMGPQNQADFVNAVARLETGLAPEELLAALQAIEQAHGRERTEHWGPRTLDLDILLYGQLQLDTATLTLPHAGISQRSFVLLPLSELDPTLDIPGAGALPALLSACPMPAPVRLDENNLQTDAGC